MTVEYVRLPVIFITADQTGHRAALSDVNSSPHTPALRDELQRPRLRAAPGAAVGVEADVVTERDVAAPAVRRTHPPPRHVATSTNVAVGGRVIARHAVE